MSQFTVDQALQIGFQYQQTGQWLEAEDIYRQVLEAYPDQIDALHLLGVLAHQCNRNEVAEEMIRKAIAAGENGNLAGPRTAFRLSLGSVLQGQNRLDDAVAHYRETIALDSTSADAYSHLGVALSAQERFGEAVEAFENAIRLDPNHPAANGNLGIALCHLGRDEEAIRVLRSAVAHQPKIAAFHASLGAALYRISQWDAAAAACQQALSLDSTHGLAHHTLSLVYKEMERLTDSADAASRAAEALPDLVDVQVNYGEALTKIGRYDDAVTHYRKCLERRPESAELHTNLANVLKDQGLLDEAMVEYRLARQFRPDMAAYHSNILYTLQFHPTATPHAVFEEHREFDRTHAQPLAPQHSSFPNDRDPARRLRVGYISNEFRGHVIGLNLLPLLLNHDPAQVETFCYSDVTRPDFFTHGFMQSADRWISIVGKSDAQVAEMVQRDKIDILLELSLHLAGNRLLVFARRPAPIQISFAGYPGTTGLSAIDYRLTDPYLDPPDGPAVPSSEVALRLPDSFWCYRPRQPSIPVNTLPAKDLGYITFGNLNNFCKINEKTMELWALIMRGVTRSRLLTLTPEGTHRQRMQAFFERRGISADRVDFVNRTPADKYLRAYHRIDLGLDSFPYNGHTTGLDSFYMGVPIVTMIGDTPVSRAGWCQLMNLGLPELAAKTPSEFVRLAIEVANNWPRLAELRAGMRERMAASPLMDETRFTRNIEAAYRTVWKRWCAAGP
jgi:predicted O-linked N-acetylglucosamine transferase (SPINDLY family)